MNSVVAIEIYDCQSDDLITKYENESSIDKVNTILDIRNWEKAKNIDKDVNPIYTLKLHHFTTL